MADTLMMGELFTYATHRKGWTSERVYRGVFGVVWFMVGRQPGNDVTHILTYVWWVSQGQVISLGNSSWIVRLIITICTVFILRSHCSNDVNILLVHTSTLSYSHPSANKRFIEPQHPESRPHYRSHHRLPLHYHPYHHHRPSP